MNKVDLKIDWATFKSAKYACENWHYSKCLPSSMQKRVAIGAWEDGIFIGVIIFGHGANPSIGKPYGLNINECIELTRIALKRGHKSFVSQIMAIAIKMLKKAQPGIKLIVSYADQEQGHHGGIYQATNWIYEGLKKGVDKIFYNGRAWHAKALRTSFQNIDVSKLKKIKSGDKHKYLMPLDKKIKKEILKLKKEYPKNANEV